jgi:formate hydrogenlyase subunit 3/multisubunit Na+/H+ antiporter MnhD subunit
MGEDMTPTKARQEVITESVRGLFIINGGGAVSLLAFLQAIWKDSPSLARIVLAGLLFMAAGLVFAAFVNYFRYHASFEHQSGNESEYQKNRSRVMWFQKLSIASFVVSVLVLVIGAYVVLNCSAA